MRTMQRMREELLLKEIRTAYWELNHSVPNKAELEALEALEAEAGMFEAEVGV
jgi:hypothetical protein